MRENVPMTGRPQSQEAAPYYYKYIDRISNPDIVGVLEAQLQDTLPLLESISEEQSLFRYAPDKWSIRQSWSHVTDCERVFLSRAFWFARGFDSPLPSFDQNTCTEYAQADTVAWANHIQDFRAVRLATLSFFRNLPENGWMRTGIGSGNPFTVRSLAYIIAGHLDHHREILEQRYCVQTFTGTDRSASSAS